ALADIDRQILSTLDRSYIIETVIRHLQNLVEANHVCVITIEDFENGSLILHVNKDAENGSIEKRNITIGMAELTELIDCKNYMLLDEFYEKVYTKALIEKGDKSFLIYPVHTKKELSAFICISSDKKLDFDESKLLQLREMADRVAVALSNAAWEEKLFQQAHYDLLTQLPNRLYFKNRLEQELELARRNGSNMAVLFIDLDRFKNINDSLGHMAGDKVLIQMGEMLRNCVRRSEAIARLGGDEFVVIMSETESEEAVSRRAIKLSHRILRNMRKPFRLGHREIYITPSIGIALYPRDGDNSSDLLKNADTAMYNAKNAGRDCYKFYNKEQNENTLELLDLENHLRHAIERNELDLLYQPKICCESGNVIGAEALLRWKHPKLGVLQPDAFISLAEETGMIATIGYWVLKTACLQNMIWRDKGVFKITMAVNLSADQFRQIDLYNNIKIILEETNMLPKYLELEITESITIENFKKTIEALENLKKLGVVIAIDDFGTGYSSLSYLQQFPIDKVKIDRSFIKNITENKDSVSIVKAIIALAHSLNLTVISEGVETQAQYDLLRNMNCDEAQGFYFGPAISAEEFEDFVTKS
ncbi:MAG: EAL domain-containing protein, partial [Crocinitomicaceae bacterium]|nr:EAL domain-containing protein [Crocinitomicaceae bacterium]